MENSNQKNDEMGCLTIFILFILLLAVAAILNGLYNYLASKFDYPILEYWKFVCGILFLWAAGVIFSRK